MDPILLLKRDILSKVLSSLRDSWEMAEGLLEVLTHTEPGESFINGLFDIVEKGLLETKSIMDISEVERTASLLQRVRGLEKQERSNELAYCNALEKTLNDFTIF